MLAARRRDLSLVHRDLKPENIFLLADGQVKILDFGLARPAPVSSDVAATIGVVTHAGGAVGTIGYMSPEQVRARPVDARTDLFALGTVLYEMVTGLRAFQRDSPADTISAILNEDPPEPPTARAQLPPALDRIVRHCLEKNPAERFQTARDVAFALAAFTADSSVGAEWSAGARTSARRRWLPVFAVGLVVLVVLAAGFLLVRTYRSSAPPIAFAARTWDPQWITQARYAPDGETIVFSAAPTGSVPRLFVIRPNSVISEPIGEPGLQMLSISSKGELAVLTGARVVSHRVFRGTLARMTLDGGARPWLQNVAEADWSPDGATLAVTRTEGNTFQLEYPIGKVLYRTAQGYVSDLRVSPDGARVAFFDHQLAGDDRGWVKVVDREGRVQTLAGEYLGLEGLAWSADGRTILFSSADVNDDVYQVRFVNATGTAVARQPFSGADSILVQDAGRDGRLLVIREDQRASIRALIPGETAERESPWLDIPGGGWLSRDRASLLFTDQSKAGGENYAVMLRALDSGKVVKLGDGSAGPLSPDGQWTAALVPSTGDLVLYPAGPGEPTRLARGPIEHYVKASRYGFAAWFPDGRRLLLCGTAAGRPPRCYEQEVPAGAPKPVTPEGMLAGPLADDGRTLLVRTTAGDYQTLIIGDNAATPVKGITPEDTPISRTSDRRSIVVWTRDMPAHVERVDIATGARTPIREIAPPDRAGVTLITPTQWIDDGRGYVYAYNRYLSKLFVVSGAKVR